MNMSQAQKEALQVLVEGGAEVATVAYNPGLVVGDPEGDAVGWGGCSFNEKILLTWLK